MTTTQLGFVETPDAVVDRMVQRLFADKPPTAFDKVMDPGCGQGAFFAGVLRWCQAHGAQVPRMVGVELDAMRAAYAAYRFMDVPEVTIEHRGFLGDDGSRYDYIIGNPPYVSITHVAAGDRVDLRERYATARGRFDLYALFFEQALGLLAPGGRLVFITPEKFLSVASAAPLRRLLAGFDVAEVLFLPEDTFAPLTTYPVVTTVRRASPGATRVVRRDGTVMPVRWPADGASLQPMLHGLVEPTGPVTTLADVCTRVNCGVATGADDIYLCDWAALPKSLAGFAHPTVAGRDLTTRYAQRQTSHVLLVPYDRTGALRTPKAIGALGTYLAYHKIKLEERTCALHKPWYAFHDTPPMRDLLRPKILCKDLAATPGFWVDRAGAIVPRHSVYYLVPRDPASLDELAAYLNGPEARAWLLAHCQRAANGFIRLQSEVLKRLPVPKSFARWAATAGETTATQRKKRPARHAVIEWNAG